MRGKDCVAIASDLRFGVQGMTIATNYEVCIGIFIQAFRVIIIILKFYFTINSSFQKVFEIGPQLYVGLPGLATDTETVLQRLKLRVNLYELKEGRKMQPAVLTAMIANMLYERR